MGHSYLSTAPNVQLLAAQRGRTPFLLKGSCHVSCTVCLYQRCSDCRRHKTGLLIGTYKQCTEHLLLQGWTLCFFKALFWYFRVRSAMRNSCGPKCESYHFIYSTWSFILLQKWYIILHMTAFISQTVLSDWNYI